MKTMMLLLSGLLMLGGCSELRVIGKAAIRELGSDAINVEQASYKKPAPQPPEQKTVVAQAPPPKQDEKKPRQKGLWEHL